MERHIKKPANHSFESRPEVSLTFPRQAANATSKRPAIISRSQFTFYVFISCLITEDFSEVIFMK